MAVSEFVDIAIIGGGYTGAVLALQLLLRCALAGTQIAIVELCACSLAGSGFLDAATSNHINVPAEQQGRRRRGKRTVSISG